MALYKIISSTNPQFNGVMLPLSDDIVQGEDLDLLGNKLKVVQAGGGIITLTDKNTAIVLQKQVEAAPVAPTIIRDPADLKINKEIDLFFETKEIRINIGNDSKVDPKEGLTYDALFKFLMKEWQLIASAFPEYASLPMEHEFGNNYCLINGWNWFENYNSILKEGCWSRKDTTGRHI